MPTVFPRQLRRLLVSGKKSLLLLGPRQTGKSTLLKSLGPELTINLADEGTYLEFLRNPRELSERLGAKRYRSVFVDEVQRLPSLLNTIQAILDDSSRPPRFLLSGSSARKLRRGQANLLPGRLHGFALGPLVLAEIGAAFSLERALSVGTLPGIYSSARLSEAQKTLGSYVSTYLKEEVQAESLTRNLEGFARFLSWAGACSGQSLDFARLSKEAQVPRQTAVRYFEILEDTLLVHRCGAFAKSNRRRLIQHPKYYFFDVGVLNALVGNFGASIDRKGLLFEHLFVNQVLHSAAAFDRTVRVSTFRTEHGAEVDFIIELEREVWAVELKASRNVGPTDLRGLARFADWYGRPHRSVVLYQGSAARRLGKTDVLPWQAGLAEMGFG
jgi:uncharacterized protein